MVARLRNFLLATLLLTGLAACGGEAGGLFDTMGVAEAAKTELFDTHGLTCDIGFNINNGRLSRVTVGVAQAEVSDLTIDDIARLVEPVIRRHFKESPDALILNVVISK